MSRFARLTLILTLVGLLFTAVAPVAMANGTFDISVKHNINGRSLGLEKDLPVDVCVNGGKAFTFEFKDSVETSLPAGNYKFDVYLADSGNCSGTPVMSLGPVDIPAGADVSVEARLSANKTPILDARIR